MSASVYISGFSYSSNKHVVSTLNHSAHLYKSPHCTQHTVSPHKCTFSEEMINKLSVSVLFLFPPCGSIHVPLFASCSSSPFLIYGPDFLPSCHQPSHPPRFTDLPLFSCPSSFPAEEAREPLSPGSANAAESCVRLVLL